MHRLVKERNRENRLLYYSLGEKLPSLKNSVSTNLMVLDEVFDSSLDGQGTEEFLKIIKYVIGCEYICHIT